MSSERAETVFLSLSPVSQSKFLNLGLGAGSFFVVGTFPVSYRLLAESLPSTQQVQAAVTPQTVTTRMCQNIAKCSLGGKVTPPPTG